MVHETRLIVAGNAGHGAVFGGLPGINVDRHVVTYSAEEGLFRDLVSCGYDKEEAEQDKREEYHHGLFVAGHTLSGFGEEVFEKGDNDSVEVTRCAVDDFTPRRNLQGKQRGQIGQQICPRLFVLQFDIQKNCDNEGVYNE